MHLFHVFSCRGLIATCFVGTGWKYVIEKRVIPRYVASAGVCLLLQLWSVSANLEDNIVKMLYFSGHHSLLLFRFQFKSQSGDGMLHWYSSVPLGTCMVNCPTNGNSVQFSLCNSIKSITILKDLLDIEQVIVQYMYRYLCINIQFTK